MVDIIHRIGIKAPLSRVYDAVATAEWRAVLEHQYWAATYREGADLGVFLDRDRAAMRDALRALGLMS